MQQTHPAIGGLWLPLITPFVDGAVDSGSLARLVRHYCRLPVDGLIVAATTGEGLTLDAAETQAVANCAAVAANGTLPVFLGLSGSDTAQLTEQLKTTASWPIGGYLVSCPYYSRPSQQGLLQHFSTLAAATDRPLLMYNIPYRTGVNLSNETVCALAGIPNIVGLKDCCQDNWQTFDLIRSVPSDFSVMTGEDALYYGALTHGAAGAILAAGHIETSRFAMVQRLLQDDDWPDALAEWQAIADLTRLLFAEPNPAAIKHWLWREGLITSPELRLPMTDVSAELAARIDAAMARR